METRHYGKLSREWWMWKLQRHILKYMDNPCDSNKISLHQLVEEYHSHYQASHNTPALEIPSPRSCI